MIKYLIYSLFIFSFTTYAGQIKNPVVENRILSFTFTVNNCNRHSASLNVAPNCQEDRGTRNYALACSAELTIVSVTRMGCGGSFEREFVIDLDKANIASESKTLYLNYQGEKYEIKIQ